MTRHLLFFARRFGLRSQKTGSRSGQTGLIVVVSLLLAVLMIGAVWFWPRTPAQPTADEGRQVAEEFLTQIREGRAAQAWESTTAEFKSALGREKFLKQVKQHPFLSKPLEFVEVQSVEVQQAGRTEAVYRAKQGQATVRLLAGNESGSWRIDRMTIGNP